MPTSKITPRAWGQPEAVSFLCTVKNSVNLLQCLVGQVINNAKGDFMLTDAGLGVATKQCNVLHCTLKYMVNGVHYCHAGACVTLTGCAVPVCRWGAWRIERSATATCVIPACKNVCGKTSSAAIIACLPALTANWVSVGTLSAVGISCNITPGSTAISCTCVCDVYTDGATWANCISTATCTPLALSCITLPTS